MQATPASLPTCYLPPRMLLNSERPTYWTTLPSPLCSLINGELTGTLHSKLVPGAEHEATG